MDTSLIIGITVAIIELFVFLAATWAIYRLLVRWLRTIPLLASMFLVLWLIYAPRGLASAFAQPASAILGGGAAYFGTLFGMVMSYLTAIVIGILGIGFFYSKEKSIDEANEHAD